MFFIDLYKRAGQSSLAVGCKNAISGLRRFGSSAVLLILLAVFVNTAAAAVHREALLNGIAQEVVRFHVLANSDSEQDQAVKYLVRDAVLEWMAREMPEEQDAQAGVSGREETLQFLYTHLDGIETAAEAVLREEGVAYQAFAELTWSYFPERTYGACTFPAGWYEALRLKLGEAKGQNWWCVLFPRLCFTDCLHAVVEEDQMERLENVLTAEEYESLLQSPQKWKIAFRWF